MTPAEFKKRMNDILESSGGDVEADHIRADDLLLECLMALGYRDGCEIYGLIHKWYA